jgi:hypothetical protein
MKLKAAEEVSPDIYPLHSCHEETVKKRPY